MNGTDDRPDLLTHKHRPDSIDKFRCHMSQAQKLRQWILDFINISKIQPNNAGSDSDEIFSDSECSDAERDVKRKCVLLTGPPGVGKTSLVYTVAKELNLHVIESNISERRDSKLFHRLKLTNQKGKINPIASLFQVANNGHHQPQQFNEKKKHPTRKRRKLSDTTNGGDIKSPPQSLSLSGDISIILFDDVDVTFSSDGPFFKPLVDFIRESKRPVILTATESISRLKDSLEQFDHIHMAKPMIEDCCQILKSICKREKYHKASRMESCRAIASSLDCDIRRCLNRIHFYGDEAGEVDDGTANKTIDILKMKGDILDLNDSRTSRTDIFSTRSILDLISTTTTIEHDYYNQNLGEQIQASICELAQKCYYDDKSANDLANELSQASNLGKRGLQSARSSESTDDGGCEDECDWSFTDWKPGKQTGLMFLRRSNRALRQKSSFDLL